MKHIVRFFALAVLMTTHILVPFNKVVIWGHKLHSHTHSYIHNAFYRTFKSLGYDTYWFDNRDDVRKFDFSNTLFITEGTVDHNIPLRADCRYMLHNCTMTKYQPYMETGHAMIFQVYSHDVLGRPTAIKIAPCIYQDITNKVLYMPWATDLLPHEIDVLKADLHKVKKEKTIYWIGTVWDGFYGNMSEINAFKRACGENGIQFDQKMGVSIEENARLTQKSYMAPTLVGTWQCKVGYVPCRIFKNMSYGQLGITNSKQVAELFEGKIVFNPNPYQLFYDAKKRLENFTREEQYELMDLVKNKHTYINRIQTLLDFLKLVEEKYGKKNS